MKKNDWLEEYERRLDMLSIATQEMSALLEDSVTLEMIGDKTPLKFERFLHQKYPDYAYEENKVTHINGHRVALILYYCATFNAKGLE